MGLLLKINNLYSAYILNKTGRAKKHHPVLFAEDILRLCWCSHQQNYDDLTLIL
jgi:hypothetical protein